MVDTFEEKKELEELKQKHKIELAEIQMRLTDNEHQKKMERLEKMLEIAKTGANINEFREVTK